MTKKCKKAWNKVEIVFFCLNFFHVFLSSFFFSFSHLFTPPRGFLLKLWLFCRKHGAAGPGLLQAVAADNPCAVSELLFEVRD